MKILHLNDNDIIGRRFNGYDLSIALQNLNIDSKMLVLNKESNGNISEPIVPKNEMLSNKWARAILQNLQYELMLDGLVNPMTKYIFHNKLFQEADIIHLHLLHNNLIGLFMLEEICKLKKVVWTIHDPWMITGQCIHPLECEKWMYGCLNCKVKNHINMSNVHRKAADFFRIKKEIYGKSNFSCIVASNFMMNYLKRSPLINNEKQIFKIPFGLDLEKFQDSSKKRMRKKYNINNHQFVIGFRADNNMLKGLDYIIKALEKVDFKIVCFVIGNQKIQIKNKFCEIINLGWIDSENEIISFYNSIDLFIMPSLAESFGLMAVESMATQTPVLIFENTVLEEITNSPYVGISVKYKNHNEIYEKLKYYSLNKEELIFRGTVSREEVKKRFDVDNYVLEHVKIYKKIMSETD